MLASRFVKAPLVRPSGHSGPATAPQPRPAPGRAALLPAPAAAPQARDAETIENLNTDYCDDFECTSSPAVEATVRAMARALGRGSAALGRNFLSRGVQYRDSFRSFTGPEGYTTLNFVETSVTSPRCTVLKMRMLDNQDAIIEWRLTGSIGPLPVEVLGETALSLNVLTGQIDKHTESWDLSKSLLPSRLAWNISRAAWSAQQASADAAAGAERVLNSLTSVDEEEDGPSGGYLPNPNDPMKFFQSGQDDFKNDALLFTGVVAVMYFMVQAWTSLDKL